MNRVNLRCDVEGLSPQEAQGAHRGGRFSGYKRCGSYDCVGAQYHRDFEKRNRVATEQSDTRIGSSLRHRSCHYAERQERISARVSASGLRGGRITWPEGQRPEKLRSNASEGRRKTNLKVAEMLGHLSPQERMCRALLLRNF